jgi:hypothetical protein
MDDARAGTFPIVWAAYRGQIANASDDALLALGSARLLELTDLQSASGAACMAIVMGREGNLAADARGQLAAETRRATIESVADVLESATPGRKGPRSSGS